MAAAAAVTAAAAAAAGAAAIPGEQTCNACFRVRSYALVFLFRMKLSNFATVKSQSKNGLQLHTWTANDKQELWQFLDHLHSTVYSACFCDAWNHTAADRPADSLGVGAPLHVVNQTKQQVRETENKQSETEIERQREREREQHHKANCLQRPASDI